MRAIQAGAVGGSVLIVLTAYLVWSSATGSFNPNPSSTTIDTSGSCIPSSPPCPAFAIESANLTLRTFQDVTSQELTLRVQALGPSDISRMLAFFSQRSVGSTGGEILPSRRANVSWAIPTTLNVTEGKSYLVYVEAQYLDPSGGGVVATYWSSVLVVAR